MHEKIRIALVGISGFSRFHYERIKELECDGGLKLVAVMVLPALMDEFRDRVQEFKREGLRIYTSYADMLVKECGQVELVVLPTGIGDHCDMSIAAMKAGYNVLCEKPVAGTLDECRRMVEAQEQTGRLLGIGFQNIYSPVIQRMKQIALSGELGALKSAKSCVLWQRADAYYRRVWAGKLVFEGKTINDCPMMNATAHFLNNMLYVAGQSEAESARPVSIYAENYRVKRIESCDTQFLRVITDTDVRLTFITSHASDVRVDPVAEYLFENGRIVWDFSGDAVVSQMIGGDWQEIETIAGDCGIESLSRKAYIGIRDAILHGHRPAAVVQNSYQHVMCVDKSFESGPIVDVLESYVGVTEILEDDDCLKAGDLNRFITGIGPLVKRLLADELSFHEAGCSWAVPSTTVHMTENDIQTTFSHV